MKSPPAPEIHQGASQIVNHDVKMMRLAADYGAERDTQPS
jgi:hypothetical protein